MKCVGCLKGRTAVNLNRCWAHGASTMQACGIDEDIWFCNDLPLQCPGNTVAKIVAFTFLTKFITLIPKIIINIAITANHPRRRVWGLVPNNCCKTVALGCGLECNSMIFTGLDGSKRVPVFPQKSSPPGLLFFCVKAGMRTRGFVIAQRFRCV